jgi:Domain of unknown function (DUF4129)
VWLIPDRYLFKKQCKGGVNKSDVGQQTSKTGICYSLFVILPKMNPRLLPWLLLSCLSVVGQLLLAQTPTDAPSASEGRTIRPKAWEDAARDLDYSRDVSTGEVEIGDLEYQPSVQESQIPLPQQGSGGQGGSEQQGNNGGQAPQNDRQPNAKDWEEAQRDLDYSRDKYKEEEPIKPLRNRTNSSFEWGGFGQILMYFMLGILGVCLLWMVYILIREPRNRKFVRPKPVVVDLDNLEAHIHETDLERFIREALEQGNYNLAVRVYYLQMIKNLSLLQHIVWKRDKTNRDYCRELSGHELAAEFNTNTRTFEQVWYGNATITEPVFRVIETQMKAFLNRIPT